MSRGRGIQHLRRARISGDHQPVPCSDDFIVQVRAWPFGANRKQFLAALRQRVANFLFAFLKTLSRPCDRMAFDQNIFAAELIVRITSFGRVAVRLHGVMEIKNLSGIAECVVDFFFCPDVESAFGSFV